MTLRNKVGTIALLSEIPDKNSWNYDDRYLKLTGGTMNGNARIGHGSGNLYIGNSGNDGWLAVQDICSQNSIGDGKWSIRVDGTASFQSIKFPSNRLISQVSNGSNSPLKGIKLPDLQSNGIGIFSRIGNDTDEGGIVLSEDTCVIYNSFDAGWGLSVRDKDLNNTDISSDDTVAFGIRQNYKLYSRGGFEKKDSSDNYVLLGGGGHSKITDLSVANADTVDGYHANGLLTALSNSDNGISITVGGTTKSVSNISVNYASSAGSASKVYGQVGDTGSHELVRCDMNNDQFRIIAGSSGNNNGWAEIATADDGNEPIYVRQYTGVFSSVKRTLTLLDANGYTHFPSYINIGGNENNNSSPDRVWGSNGSDSYLRSYRTSALSVNYASSAGNADTVDGVHANQLCRIYTFNVHNSIIKVGTLTSGQSGHVCKLRFNSGIGYNAGNQDKTMTVVIRASNGGANSNGFYFEAHSESYRGGAFTTFYLHQTSKTQCELYMSAFNWSGQSTYEVSFSAGDSWTNEISVQNALPTSNIFTLPNYQIAYTDYNVASATKLATARNIWGQSFDGTGDIPINVAAKMPYVFFKRFDNNENAGYVGCGSSSNNNIYIESYINANILLNGNNIGISTYSPTYKLHVAGDIYSSSTIRTAAQNQAIVLSNDASAAWISALEGQIIFNTGNAIRFGGTDWDWNQWAGLKYTHSNKTIYLGIADGSAFNANSTQSNGTLRLAGITTVTPNSGARIGNSGGDLYLGNVSNNAWVKVQDICSQADSNNWAIYQSGSAKFKNLTINSDSTFNSSVKVNNMLTAKAINATTADINAFGTKVNNWDGSIAANVTNMFNGIDSNNISIEYSTNGGSSWNKYTINPNYLFNLINDNSDTENFYLGNDIIPPDNEAEKLAQIKRNQLRVTVKIPNEVYQELSWISVDVSNGVDIKCQVYFGNSNGVYTEYVSKVFNGWSHRCDICVGPSNVNVGNDIYRYVRLVFSHLSSHTALRNGNVSRIRALALTKYNNPSGRYNISTTGHIYNFDYNMNTYFPNSILAKGGVTAYQSSDVRLKTNITKLNCLKVIKSIGGTYEFDYIRNRKHSIGFIAQNVNNPLLNDIIAKDDNGYLKINYWNPKLISLAFGALTEIDDEVDKLKARVRELESEVEYLKNKDYVLQ